MQAFEAEHPIDSCDVIITYSDDNVFISAAYVGSDEDIVVDPSLEKKFQSIINEYISN